MKQSIVRVATAVWVIGLVLTGFFLSVPPANVPIFIGLACIAIVPLVFGTRRFQIFGIAAIAVSLMLAYGEHLMGMRLKIQKQRIRQILLQSNSISNAPTTNASPATHE